MNLSRRFEKLTEAVRDFHPDDSIALASVLSRLGTQLWLQGGGTAEEYARMVAQHLSVEERHRALVFANLNDQRAADFAEERATNDATPLVSIERMNFAVFEEPTP